MPLPCPLSTCTHMFKVTHAHMHTGKHACTPRYTPTYFHTHAHSRRLPHPAEPDLCLAPALYPPLSLLISGKAEEVLQETTPTALCSDLACMSVLFLAAAAATTAATPASGCSPEQEDRKQRILTPFYSGLWLVSSVAPEKALQRGLNQWGL